MAGIRTESHYWRSPCNKSSVIRHPRWLISLMVVLSLALAVYVTRAQLQRAVTAVAIYRAHIFTAPQPNASESGWHRLRDAAQFYWDFSEIPVARDGRLKLLNPTLRPLVKELNRRQAAGEDMHYSMHIYREIRWRLNFTPDNAATHSRISDLRQSLTQPEERKNSDGSPNSRSMEAGDGESMCGISNSTIPLII
jgi:hypothetical protein